MPSFFHNISAAERPDISCHDKTDAKLKRKLSSYLYSSRSMQKRHLIEKSELNEEIGSFRL